MIGAKSHISGVVRKGAPPLLASASGSMADAPIMACPSLRGWKNVAARGDGRKNRSRSARMETDKGTRRRRTMMDERKADGTGTSCKNGACYRPPTSIHIRVQAVGPDVGPSPNQRVRP